MQFTPEGIFKNLQLVQGARGKKVIVSYKVTISCTYTYPPTEHRPCGANSYPGEVIGSCCHVLPTYQGLTSSSVIPLRL